MKKILVLVVAVVCAGIAQAADYPYLVFTNTAGTQTALTVSNMTLSVNGSELTVTNDDGTVNFSLMDLASMQFRTESGEWAAVENVLDGDGPVDVYTILGVKVGHYNSLPEAAGVLGQGSYVITNGKVSQTIFVR